MNYNIALIVWFVISYVIIQSTNSYRTENVAGEQKKRLRPEMAFLVVLPLIILAGIRSFNYADTSAYVPTFNNMPDTLAGIPEYMETVRKDKGYYLFACLIKTVISTNPRVYLFVMAIIHGTAVAMVFRKFSDSYLLSMFLFVVSTDYMAWMYNGLRQFTAVILIFAATEYILEKKYLKVFLIILLAYTMHGTALIMIPIVFIMYGRAWNFRTILVIVVSMLALRYVGEFTNVLEEILQETQYTYVVSDWEAWGDDGTNIIRVLVYSIPAILSFVGMKYIKHANDPIINMATNASIISAGIYLISSGTSGIYIGRLPIYVSLYGYILLPWMISNFFTKDSQKIVRVIMIGCYLAFYGYSVLNGMGAGAWN